MMKLLTSLRLTTWSLLALAIWLGLGAVAVGLSPRAPGFQSLDAATLQAWLSGQAGAHPWLTAWLLVLLLVAGVLMLNLALCSYKKLAPGTREGRGRRLLVLAVHVLALAAMTLQGASFFTGAKQTRVKLAPGQSLPLGNGASLRLSAVEFINDPALLRLKGRAARRAMGRDAFDRHRNLGRVELLQPGRAPAEAVLRCFAPAELGSWRVFLMGFHLAGRGERARVGATLNLVQSPLWTPFFLTYGGLVAGLIWLTLLELRRTRRRQDKPPPG